MKTRKLPARFDDHAKATAWGAEVARGETRLDWSQVTEATTEALEALFGEAHPSEFEGPLGLGDLPEAFAESHADRMLAAMEATTPSRPRQKAALEAATWESSFVAENPVEASVAKAKAAAERAQAQAQTTKAPPALPGGKTRETLRDELLEMVARDLVGPSGDTAEQLEEPQLLGRYLLGRLAPRGAPPAEDELADEVAEGHEDSEEDAVEVPAPAARRDRPSSMGMTLTVTASARSLIARVAFATYERVKGEPESESTKPNSGRLLWDRHWHQAPPLEVTLADGPLGPWSPHPAFPDVRLRGLGRRLDGDWIVSLFLVNEQEAIPDAAQDEDDSESRTSQRNAEAERWLHQVELLVEGPEGASVLRRRPVLGKRNEDDREERHAALRFRKQVEFAVGHGAAIEVLDASPDGSQARAVRTTPFPRTAVRLQQSPSPDDTEGAAGLETSMAALADPAAGDFGPRLLPLARAYELWIQERRARVDAGEDGLGQHTRAAEEALQECQVALERIREGIALLDRDALAAECFRFANDAMRRQRERSEVVRRRVAGEAPGAEPAAAHWRLFQLGYILMNLPSLARLDHPDRRLGGRADLLWFPTGGGKTEAYLGVAAFAMAIRRLRGPIEGRPGDRGVAVLMRYTLRLLTIQQFQRAATLICACEEIRRERLQASDGRLGSAPFTIGLWVGKKTTPNTTAQSFDAVSVLKGSYRATRSGSPLQIAHCPWCGHAIDSKSSAIEVDKTAGRTRISCGDATGACLFSHMRLRADGQREGLPILTVDEEIYRRLPTLLLATVDKLAQLPWQGGSGQLFGRVEKHCPRHGYFGPSLDDKTHHKASRGLPAVSSEGSPSLQPPDLVIQDELHLISGPLGSMVGLYEAAVDELSAWQVAGQEVRPKILASTATIRRAEEQGKALFARKVLVFPPPGVDADDSFFAHTPPGAKQRTYVGICAPGTRKVTVLLRVYAAYMAAAQKLSETYGVPGGENPADPWMTLVGYFNSLRDLGGMRRVVEDRLSSLLFAMARRGLASRPTPNLDELTSRLDSIKIPAVLASLERPIPVPRPKWVRGTPRTVDVLLATNMISVGVDVNRLGLMVVAGQPRATSEYIQATSRVGRQHPGIVCTVYDWMRPRDLSHFERFSHYHATFYRQVEATSVTPFAPGALERGLPGVLVGLIRQLELDLNENARAQDMSVDHAAVKRAMDALRRRVQAATDDERLTRDLNEQMRALLDRWLHRVQSRKPGENIGYRGAKDGDTRALLTVPGMGDETPGLACMTSLRDVEPDIPLLFDPRPPREEDLGPPDTD